MAEPTEELPSREKVLGFMAMVVGMFMAILDIQIVAASLPEIQAGLGATPDEGSWVQTSYLIAEVVMIPLSGTLSRLWSTRVLFVASALGFTIASALCAFATSLPEMIVLRAVQGFVGGAMIPTVFATSFLLFRGHTRVRMSVLIGLVATMAPTIGPTLGGWLTQALSWHWLFLVNLPVGLIVATVVWRGMNIDMPDPNVARGFDFLGLGMMATMLGSLEYVLEEGPRQDWFSDDLLLALAVLAGLAALGFFWRMFTAAQPIVDLRAYADRNFAIGSVFSFIMGIGLYGAIYVIPQFLSRVRGYDSLQIGETMFVTGLFMLASAPIAGRLARFVDLRVLLACGLGMFGTALWLTARLTSQSAFWELFLPQGLRGFSTMFIMLPVNQIALGTLAPARLKNAAGLYNLMRNFGGAVGLALINTLTSDRFALHWLHLAEGVRWDSAPAMDRLHHMAERYATQGGDGMAEALRAMARAVERQAWTLTYNDVLLVIAAGFALVLPLTTALARPRLSGAPAH